MTGYGTQLSLEDVGMRSQKNWPLCLCKWQNNDVSYEKIFIYWLKKLQIKHVE